VTGRASGLLVLSLSVVLAGCGSRGGPPPRFPGSTLKAPDARREDRARFTSALVQTALALQGTPYRFGGKSEEGFDCSGLVGFVFAQHGVRLPAGVRAQWTVGERVGRDRIEPGDLVFFVTAGRTVSHVGIAIDGESFIHAPNSIAVVRVERLDDLYWGARFAGARRIAAPAPATG